VQPADHACARRIHARSRLTKTGDDRSKSPIHGFRLSGDDLAVMADGRTMVATHTYHSVQCLYPDGRREDIAGHDQVSSCKSCPMLLPARSPLPSRRRRPPVEDCGGPPAIRLRHAANQRISVHDLYGRNFTRNFCKTRA
jgi:hypothetical protein